MEIYTEICKGLLAVTLKGEFDLNSAEKFRKEVDPYISRAGIKDLIVDMEGISFLDSSGVGALLGRYKAIKARGGSVALCGAENGVKKVLALSGLLALMNVYENKETALAKF